MYLLFLIIATICFLVATAADEVNLSIVCAIFAVLSILFMIPVIVIAFIL